jgi:pyridinium-3,5-bisthiocarboxylic acid mononucleotide nickel chelatase
VSERILYLDCFSGVAGDMALGALIDLGADVEALRAALGTLPLPDWHLRVDTVNRSGITATDVHVEIGGREEGPAQDDHDHEHDPAGDHTHDDHTHHHHYHYAEVMGALAGGALPTPVVERAQAAFDALAEAEAKVHGLPKEQVHFHEVGAVDGVIDIAGVAWCLWHLGVDHLESAPPPMTRGFMRCAHGRLPLPAPATLELLRGFQVSPCDLKKELVTPTGAAFLAAWARRVGGFPAMTIERIGWGAGDIELPDRPNLLRMVLGRTDPAPADCWVVETNLDDQSPEQCGYLLERLFEAGALDAWFSPLHMKKSRPAVMVGALCTPGARAAIEHALLSESTAIGLRRYPVTRQVMSRRVVTVQTPFGPVPMKIAGDPTGPHNAAPEYEACAALARAAGIPLKVVYQHAVAAWMGRPA